MKISAKHLLATAGVTAMMAAPSYAQITIDGNISFESTGSPVSTTFDASGFDKLVVLTVGEHGFNNAAGKLTSVTYDGVELTTVLNRDAQVAQTDTLYAAVSILDNPSTSTGFLEVTAVTRATVWAFGLSGTADGFGATVIGNTGERSVDLVTTGPDSLVFAAFNMGGAGNTANVGAVTVDAPLTFQGAQESGSNWNGHVIGTENGVGAGTQTYSFTGGNEAGAFITAIEFLAAGGGLPGDTDGDGDIDDSDLGTAFSNYTGPLAPGTGGLTAADGDTDGDGDVDDTDLGTLFSSYTGPLSPAAVPEPTSLALLGLGGLLVARRRRA
ncbi:MAG: PEP-CTERM sorting domain-containing protein [Phycisphaeraceae bacterium]